MPHIIEKRLSQRTVAVCGERLKHYRKRLGWTQEELAHQSGYSDRLIRKAESSHTLCYETICNLAQALSCKKLEVKADDLICSPKKSLQRFLDLGFTELLDIRSIQEIVTADCRLDFTGDARVPFTGLWSGIEGLFRWLALFREQLSRMKIVEETVIALDGDLGFAHLVLGYGEDGPRPKRFNLVMRITFRNSKIRQVLVISDVSKLEEIFHTCLPKQSINLARLSL